MLLQRFRRIPRVVASQIYSPGNIKGREGGGGGGVGRLVGRTNTGNPHSQSLSKYNEDSQSIYLSAYLCSDYFPLSSLIYDSPGYIVFPVECGPSSCIMQRRIKERLVQGTRVRVYAPTRSPDASLVNLYLSIVRIEVEKQ